MDTTSKHAIWLCPSGDTAVKLEDTIRELSHVFGTPVFDPHITLLSGLYFAREECNRLVHVLAGSLSSFTVELVETVTGPTVYQSLFLRIHQTPPLAQARQTAEKVFDCTPRGSYIPHVSLLYGMVDEERKKAVQSKIEAQLPLSVPIGSVQAVETEGPVQGWKSHPRAVLNHT